MFNNNVQENSGGRSPNNYKRNICTLNVSQPSHYIEIFKNFQMPLVIKGTPNTAGVEGHFILVDSGHRALWHLL